MTEAVSMTATTAQVVEMVFRSMLGEAAVPARNEPGFEPELTASLHYAGSWRGVLVIECPADFAIRFTEALLPALAPLPGAEDETIDDALGELANMIGGNLKSALPPGAEISIPTVTRGRNHSLRLCGASYPIAARAAFASPYGEFWVTLLEALRPADSGLAQR
jgi:CheY-specific phosphatase CheX